MRLSKPLHMLNGRSLHFWALAAFVASVAALAAAYVSELAYGLHPCEMCLWQRIPYAVVILLSLAACFVRSAKAQVWLLWVCVSALAAGAVLASFHAGVEWQWWDGPSACGGSLDGMLTPEQILARIRGAATVSCAEAAVRILGLSMAGWNALYSAGCAVALIAGLKTRIQE